MRASAVLLLALLLSACGRQGERGRAPAAETGLTLAGLLGDSGAGYEKVTGPRPIAFPRDHGPHPGFRSEWWYFTGNLRDTVGREYGFQLTFFRSALRPPDSAAGPRGGRTSPWAAGQAWMAHFALTEVGRAPGGGRFHAFERFGREALGLAGARAAPFRVWMEDWSAAAADTSPGVTSPFPMRLRAAQGGAGLDLVLDSARPLVLQGEAGYSRKGPEPGNASLYYSATRMPARGRVTTPDGDVAVSGEAWMDREWGSSILSPGLAGWEWFGLRLADGTDWLFFRLRPAGPEAAARDSVSFDYGMRVGPDGRGRVLGPEDRHARILSRWTSPSGRRYPSRWRIDVPGDSLVLEIAPLREDQELDLAIPYWEGAVGIEGRRPGRTVEGRGYMELTGY